VLVARKGIKVQEMMDQTRFFQLLLLLVAVAVAG
jgi:hypothetical protein